MRRVREYLRALPGEVPKLEAAGWRVVGASLFADRQVSVLLMREVTV